MPSKAVTDRQKSSLAVQTAASTHASDIATAFSREFAPFLQRGEATPDGQLLAALLERLLQAATARMVEQDEIHAAELRDDEQHWDSRDDAAERLKEALVSIRSTVRGLFGASAEATVLGVEGSTSNDPTVLLRQADSAIAKLRDPNLRLPKPKLSGVNVDPDNWAETLQGPATELREAIAFVSKENREAESTQSAKNAAIAAYDLAFRRTANLLQALLGFAGLDDLAAQVRPSTRRPGHTAGDAPAASQES